MGDTGHALAFREAVESGDIDAVIDLLHPDVVFRSPAVFRPYEGRDMTAFVLRAVFEVFEDFRYVDRLEGDGTHALVFEARVGDRHLQGWDYLAFDDAGLVTELTVMVRPLSALQALVAEMGARLGM